MSDSKKDPKAQKKVQTSVPLSLTKGTIRGQIEQDAELPEFVTSTKENVASSSSSTQLNIQTGKDTVLANVESSKESYQQPVKALEDWTDPEFIAWLKSIKGLKEKAKESLNDYSGFTFQLLMNNEKIFKEKFPDEQTRLILEYAYSQLTKKLENKEATSTMTGEGSQLQKPGNKLVAKKFFDQLLSKQQQPSESNVISSSTPDSDYVDEISMRFQFVNRDRALKDLFSVIAAHCFGWKTVPRVTEQGKPFYAVPCCFSSIGMGKTSLFSIGIRKLLDYLKSKLDDNVVDKKYIQPAYDLLKQTFEKKLILKLDFLVQPLRTGETGNFESSLAARIFHSYCSNLGHIFSLDEILGANLSLQDTLYFIQEHSQSSDHPLILIHLDETQELATWKSKDERRNSYLYGITNLLHNFIMNDMKIILLYCYSGLNTNRMDDMQVLSFVNHVHLRLPLLKTKDMLEIVNSLIQKLYGQESQTIIDQFNKENRVFSMFLDILLGNPRMLGSFLGTCSEHGKGVLGRTQSSSQDNTFPYPQKTLVIGQKLAISFSISGFEHFLSQQLYKKKEVLWSCMRDLYDGLQQTVNAVVFKELVNLRQPSCLMSLIHKVLLDAKNSVSKGYIVPHFPTGTTYGDLEEKGIIYLEPVEGEPLNFEVKMTFLLLYHIAAILKKHEVNLPILDMKHDLTWEENERSDVQLMMLKIWNYFNTMAAMSQQYHNVLNLQTMFPQLRQAILVNPPQNYEITNFTTQVRSFQSLLTDISGFVNAKGAPWADGGIKLKLYGTQQTDDFKKYCYLLIQSKRKVKSDEVVDITQEWNKCYDNQLGEDFYKQQVVFLLISDGTRISDNGNKQQEYNCIAIDRTGYGEFFSPLFLILKELKSEFKEANEALQSTHTMTTRKRTSGVEMESPSAGKQSKGKQ